MQDTDEPAVPYSRRSDILAALDAAAREVGSSLVGMTVDAARRHVEREAERRAGRIYVEFGSGQGPVQGVRKYGRIRAVVQNGAVSAASAN